SISEETIEPFKLNLDPGSSKIKYILSGDGAGTIFVINDKTGDIHAMKRLDREEKAEYTLTAQAVDRDTNKPLEPPSEFIIKVQDINDNAPEFVDGPYHATVPEMSVVGTFVTKVTATDADDPVYGNSAKLVYSILEGQPYFSIEPHTAIIKTALPNMDREAKEEYFVVIQAKDMGGHMGGLSGTTTVTITLTDVNDNPPKFAQSKCHYVYIFSFMRMLYSTFLNGFLTIKDECIYFFILRMHEAANIHIDPRFISGGPFKDTATVKIVVEDADEPPVFSSPTYLLEVHENAAINSVIGQVTAHDPDVSSSPIRFSIDRHTDLERQFNINAEDGKITLATPLDRETNMWHNITIVATETSKYLSVFRLGGTILSKVGNSVLTIRKYSRSVCSVIQIVSAVDKDDPKNGHYFLYSLLPEMVNNPNFTIKKNEDNTLSILAKHNGFSRQKQEVYLLPIIISDSGNPPMSSTSTLTIRVCGCSSDGIVQSCNVEAYVLPIGLSMGALIAILACIILLLGKYSFHSLMFRIFLIHRQL
uniref:Cadherin 8 n=1 Tax=Pavo cristatus TaxID=9049 RepID=A0A8C9L9N9_PAVCR